MNNPLSLIISDEEEAEYLALLEAEEKAFILNSWYTGNLRYKLHAAQRLIYDRYRALPKHVRDVILYCARRFGKSYLIVILALEDCIQNPGNIIRIIGPKLEDTLEIVEYNLDKIMRDAPIGLINKQGSRRRWRVGDSLLVIGGFDKQNVKKNLGKEAYAIYTEEAGNSNSEEFSYAMREIISPQLLHSKGRLTHGTTPPPELDHVFIAEYVPQADIAGTLFKFTIDDNPLADDEMRAQAIKDSGGINTAAYKRNYLVQHARDSGIVVLPSYDEKVHVNDFAIPPYANWILFGDWGGVRDRTWLGIGYWDFQRGKLCVVAEADFDPNTSTKIIAPSFHDLWGYSINGPRLPKTRDEADQKQYQWVDCHGQVQTDLAADHGIIVTLPIKDNFDASINQLELGFQNEQIEIHPRCVKLRAACQHGRFTKNRTDFERTVSLGHCDAIAGLKYGWRMVDKVTNPFPKPKLDRELYWQPPEEENSLEAFGKALKKF